MKLLAPIDQTLSLEARGLLAFMLNDMECDYCQTDNIYRYFPTEEKEVLDSTIRELCVKEYIIEFKPNLYAINKFRIPEMTAIGG